MNGRPREGSIGVGLMGHGVAKRMLRDGNALTCPERRMPHDPAVPESMEFAA
jgi:3-hydroxyisobutyrate dehydrogenase-like beta-hydroxyacid dehydrogenase